MNTTKQLMLIFLVLILICFDSHANKPVSILNDTSTAFRKKVYTVRPEPVEGHEIRFDKLSANGMGYKTCIYIYETLY